RAGVRLGDGRTLTPGGRRGQVAALDEVSVPFRRGDDGHAPGAAPLRPQGLICAVRRRNVRLRPVRGRRPGKAPAPAGRYSGRRCLDVEAIREQSMRGLTWWTFSSTRRGTCSRSTACPSWAES